MVSLVVVQLSYYFSFPSGFCHLLFFQVDIPPPSVTFLFYKTEEASFIYLFYATDVAADNQKYSHKLQITNYKLRITQSLTTIVTMKFILSLLTIFAFFAALSNAEDFVDEDLEDDCDCECSNEELNEAKRLVLNMQKNIEACEYRIEMHEKVSKMYEKNNKILSESMKTVSKADEDSQKNADPVSEKQWAKAKKDLIEQMNDLEEEMFQKEESFDKKEADYKKTIKELQKRVVELVKSESEEL